MAARTSCSRTPSGRTCASRRWWRPRGRARGRATACACGSASACGPRRPRPRSSSGFAEVAPEPREPRVVQRARGPGARARARVPRGRVGPAPLRLIGERRRRPSAGGPPATGTRSSGSRSTTSTHLRHPLGPPDRRLRLSRRPRAPRAWSRAPRSGVLLGDLSTPGSRCGSCGAPAASDVTAMPFGIDTPSLFGMVFGVLGPGDAPHRRSGAGLEDRHGRHGGDGRDQARLAFAGDWVRRVVPRAALLGSIAGVAILLIAFLPVAQGLRAIPLVGVVSLIVRARRAGGRRAAAVGPAGRASPRCWRARVVFWGRWAARRRAGRRRRIRRVTLGALGLALPWPTLAWLDALDATLPYLPLAVPFALATVVGGIDNTESAIAAGDEYRTRDILLTEAVATIAAGLLRRRDPEHALHRPPRLQGDGRAGRLHAGHRPRDRRRRRGRRRLACSCALLPEAAVAPDPGLRRARDHRAGLPRPRRRATPPRSRCPSSPRWPRSCSSRANLLLGGGGQEPRPISSGEGRLACGARSSCSATASS